MQKKFSLVFWGVARDFQWKETNIFVDWADGKSLCHPKCFTDPPSQGVVSFGKAFPHKTLTYCLVFRCSWTWHQLMLSKFWTWNIIVIYHLFSHTFQDVPTMNVHFLFCRLLLWNYCHKYHKLTIICTITVIVINYCHYCHLTTYQLW